MRCRLPVFLAALAAVPGAGAQDAPAPPPPIDIPVAIGQSIKEIRVPHYGADGKLSLRLNAARAERSSTTAFNFGELQIELFDDNAEQAALTVLLPEAVFDQNTRRLVSDRRSVIKGESIEITGRDLAFDVDSRTSRLRGPVRMILSATDKAKP